MLAFLHRWLAVKLGLLVTVAVAAGFTMAAAISSRAMMRSSARLHRESATNLATSVTSSIRMTMLSGDGGHVRRVVAEVTKHLPTVGIRVYSYGGDEVFAEKQPPPPAAQVPAHVRDVVATGRPSTTDTFRALPIVHSARCVACHREGGEHGVLGVLGVLTVGAVAPRAPPTAAAQPRVASDAEGLDVLATIILDGFYQAMLAPNSPRMDAYFQAMPARAPGVRGIAVYAPDGSLVYGEKRVQAGRADVRVATMRAEKRCLGCHEEPASVEGSTLVVAFDRQRASLPDALPSLIAVSLDQVMEAGLGRLAIGLLDDIARTGSMRALTLHDADGRLIHDAFAHALPPADVDSVLRSGRLRTVVQQQGAEFRFVEPLENEPACQGCHGSGERLRGVVEIRLNTSAERAELARLQRMSAAYAVATIALVLLLLALGIYYTVLRPVQAIGSVADLVGAGDLDQTVDIHSRDEMGRLGTRVNEMVRGLRQKLELSKFVSQGTVRAVEKHAGVVARSGEQRRIAVVFSDIRGFTPYSESHDPETVIAMLNTFLNAQAEVVARHGGDIDKFVGDEIMTRFSGPDMTRRAVRAAVEMVAVVEALNVARGDASCRIGVGVNVGNAILGAMGAEVRMDFTAIGDTVNVAARLCSAAGPGEVLVTDDVQRELHDDAELAFEALTPMRLKGKADAVQVYRVTSRRLADA
ncbi:MAG: adenylate/guanylate cyclase domain-containing protein [Gemmatimonadaceae bacterium]|jgi:adenylate cyclase